MCVYMSFVRFNKSFSNDNDNFVLLKLCTDALKSGWTKFKVKVGADLEDDIRRCRLIRQMIGPDNSLVCLFLRHRIYIRK